MWFCFEYDCSVFYLDCTRCNKSRNATHELITRARRWGLLPVPAVGFWNKLSKLVKDCTLEVKQNLVGIFITIGVILMREPNTIGEQPRSLAELQ